MTAYTLADLAALVASRAGTDPATSYTAKLLSEGPAKAAKKLGAWSVWLDPAAGSGAAGSGPASSPDDAAGAGAVLDHAILAEMALQVGGEQAGADIGRAAGRGGDDDAHRLARAPVLLGQGGRGEQAGERRAAGDACHAVPPGSWPGE